MDKKPLTHTQTPGTEKLPSHFEGYYKETNIKAVTNHSSQKKKKERNRSLIGLNLGNEGREGKNLHCEFIAPTQSSEMFVRFSSHNLNLRI